jgi:hypothetical protein
VVFPVPVVGLRRLHARGITVRLAHQVCNWLGHIFLAARGATQTQQQERYEIL